MVVEIQEVAEVVVVVACAVEVRLVAPLGAEGGRTARLQV